MHIEKSSTKLLSLPLIVASLGYFVDVLDLLLFNVVRVPSLKELGLNDDQILIEGAKILNFQQAGLLIGGIAWGIMGDKRGRLSVLFGSIVLYSIATAACGFVKDADTYAWLRFVSGVGLAGELGAGITLIAEILPKHIRSYGPSIIAGVGLLGPIAAFFLVKWFDWRTTYFIGGGLGVLLLLLRINVLESFMFANIRHKGVSKGNFLAFFTNKNRFLRYIKCLGVGLPTYLVIGLIGTFGLEFAKALNISNIDPSKCVMFVFVGSAVGDFFSGFLSQKLQSRKKTIAIMMSGTIVGTAILLFGNIQTSQAFYTIITFLGFSIGFIATFLTVTAESFGTNYRSTATTTVANFVRATTLVTLPMFLHFKTTMGVLSSAAIVAGLCFVLALISLYFIEETFDKDLDYTE